MKPFIVIILFISMFMVTSSPAAEKAPPAPSSNSKCPVCGMFVAKYRDWLSSITFKDSSTLFFDGPKDMFKFYLDPGRYGSSEKRSDIAAMYVKDYYSLDVIDGRRAYYVIGSDVLGPMGKELVPFGKRGDADSFLKDHGGKRVLSFGEINAAVMKSLE